MTKLHCWILVGEKEVRKGSVVRALTGVGTGRPARVELRNGQWLHLALATVSSVNESANPPPPQAWVQQQMQLSTKGRCNLLLCFRLTIRPGFNAQDYIDELDKAGATIESIITLGQDNVAWVPAFGVPFAAVPNSQWTPTATTARQVREFWQWA